MKLQANIKYTLKFEAFTFPGCSAEQTRALFQNGTVSAKVLEVMIANAFDNAIENDGMANAADIIVNGDKGVQLKGCRFDKYHGRTYKVGALKGQSQEDVIRGRQNIRVGQSFTSNKRRTGMYAEADLNLIDQGYVRKYDYFMIVDSTCLYKDEVSFIMVTADEICDVMSTDVQIAWNDLNVISDVRIDQTK